MKFTAALIFSLLIFSINILKAQDSLRLEKQKIHSLFLKHIDRTSFSDTNMVYMFAIKVDIIKIKSVIKIKNIQVSDTVANTIFRDLKFINQFNFSHFLKKKSKSATFIFPISIFLEYPEKSNTGLIKSTDVMSKLENLWFISNSMSYFNVPTEEFIYIPTINLRTTTWVDH